jgi:hypothetical protein
MPIDTAAWTRTLLQSAPDAKVIALGSQRTYGLLDDDEQMADDGTGQPVTVRTRQVTVAANSLSGVIDGASVTVGGTRYTVRGRPMPRENGDLWTFRVTL